MIETGEVTFNILGETPLLMPYIRHCVCGTCRKNRYSLCMAMMAINNNKETDMAKAEVKETEIKILRMNEGEVTFNILGETPLIMNRMSEKAKHQLLCPPGRKTASEKQSTLKHEPMEEFRASPYTDPNPVGPTFLTHLASAFKGAMVEAALDIPGVFKTQIERMVWVKNERIPIYGIPQMLMSVVRSADMNKTPDIRSRAIVPQWACTITVRYKMPMLREQGICNLLAAGGCSGIGDWRPAKGSGNYGRFLLVEQNDPAWLAITKNAGRAAQIAAMANPECYDAETEEMLVWFCAEVERRGDNKSNGKSTTQANASA